MAITLNLSVHLANGLSLLYIKRILDWSDEAAVERWSKKFIWLYSAGRLTKSQCIPVMQKGCPIPNRHLRSRLRKLLKATIDVTPRLRLKISPAETTNYFR